MIDLLFLAHNRLRFTEESAAALMGSTDWSLVKSISTYDDASTDGTHEFLASLRWPVRARHMRGKFGGPVATMNHFIEARKPDLFAKIDNDVLVPPGWLGECMNVMAKHSELDLLGIECNNDFPEAGSVERDYVPAGHIGGIGVMRGEVFARYGLPNADGRQGFTQFQYKNDAIRKGWINPCLCVALLDHLPMEPWKSLSEEYIRRGWQRHGWNGSNYYEEKSHRLWDWWTAADAH